MLVATGVTLLLERSLTRILLGVILLGNGVNLLILLGGRSGGAPVVGTGPDEEMSDPLPQAMVLTAIVITFGLTAFLLAVAYRSWYLSGDDEVPGRRGGPADRRARRRATRWPTPTSAARARTTTRNRSTPSRPAAAAAR